MKTAAVLTSLSEAPPADAFRPTYVGANKEIFRASSLRWDRLQNLPVDATQYPVPPFSQYERYLERPWLDHLNGAWEGQWLLPVDNQPGYGREVARIVGTASLLLNTDASQDQKRRLLYGLVQYGIDLHGMVQLGAVFNEGGGITSGRKWPVLFAGLMLDDPSFTPEPREHRLPGRRPDLLRPGLVWPEGALADGGDITAHASPTRRSRLAPGTSGTRHPRSTGSAAPCALGSARDSQRC